MPTPPMDRVSSFLLATAIVAAVADGWSGKPSPFLHQILLLPATACFAVLLVWLLSDRVRVTASRARGWWVVLLGAFQVASIAMMFAEGKHFKQFGYHLEGRALVFTYLVSVALWVFWVVKRTPVLAFAAVLSTYGAGIVTAIECFPLNYLRSDMLPVIEWADQRLLSGQNPYQTMFVGHRIYDFPYLPGMLVGFLPAMALHVDPRFVSLSCVLCCGVLVYAAARPDRRVTITVVVAGFMLCPFLQYRHDLYLQPHWLTLVLAVFLIQRRWFGSAALAWGVSCGIYQLSWVLLPFVLLNAYRHRGLREALRTGALSGIGCLLIVGPFLRVASSRIASNTVGQWSKLPHALADPINLSYWLTYVVRPNQLRWVQAVVLTGIFGYCFARGRCADLTDTLRWMCCALAIFIPLNVLVDGYFYLTLLLLLLLYTCSAEGLWREAAAEQEKLTLLPA